MRSAIHTLGMKHWTRFFSISHQQLKKVVTTNLKGKSVSSQQWLTRQLTDPYVEKAKMLNYRCRSAFKLLEMDDKFKFFHPGQIVVDCGASPGSWTQVAVKRVNADGSQSSKPRGKVISIDMQQIYPVEGAIVFGNMDFTLEDSQEKIMDALLGKKADIVISDMAPSASGIKEMDDENMMKLCYSALRFAIKVSETRATLIIKLWQCGHSKQLNSDLSKFYDNVRIVKPNSSRSDSAEIFFLARNFKGLIDKK